MTLNLDRTERAQFTTHLVNQIRDGNIGSYIEECFASLVTKFGERYGFTSFDSELEGIINDALDSIDYNRSVDAFHGIEIDYAPLFQVRRGWVDYRKSSYRAPRTHTS